MKDSFCREKFSIVMDTSDGVVKAAPQWMEHVGYSKVVNMTIRNDSFLVNVEPSGVEEEEDWVSKGVQDYLGATYGFNMGSPPKRRYNKGTSTPRASYLT